MRVWYSHLLVQHFQARVESLLGMPKMPLGIQDYMVRYEFQHRGSIHARLLLWLKDGERIRHAGLSTEEGKRLVTELFTTHVPLAAVSIPDVRRGDVHPAARGPDDIAAVGGR